MTPAATWKPVSGRLIVGPAPCQSCGRLVWFGRSLTRVQGQTQLGEVRVWREWGRYAKHACARADGRAQ